MTNTGASRIDIATDEVFRRCEGEHTHECAWHAVMAIDENAADSGDEDPEYVENALDLIDRSCNC